MEVIEINGIKVARFVSEKPLISTLEQALDLMTTAKYNGCQSVVMNLNCLEKESFQRDQGLGERILQKYAHYGMPVGVLTNPHHQEGTREITWLHQAIDLQAVFNPQSKSSHHDSIEVIHHKDIK